MEQILFQIQYFEEHLCSEMFTYVLFFEGAIYLEFMIAD